MAEEYFHGEVCGTGNWWTSSTNIFGSSLCSSNINQIPNLGWPNHMIMDNITRFNDNSSSPSDSSIVLQDAQQATGFEISSPSTPYGWTPDLLNGNENFAQILQDNLNSTRNYLQQTGINKGLDSKNWNQDSSFYSSSLDYQAMNYQSPANYLMKNPNEFSPSLPQLINPNKKPDIMNSQLIKGVVKETRGQSSVEKKTSSEPALKRSRIETPSVPLPTFKVRKEKLGDRITVLQQLVSPFGKTDTASVLYEAIEYIKFLHDQVSALNTAYMKNGSSAERRQDAKQDLRSHGLCLVPLSSTFPVATETVNDFWTPTS